MKICFLVGTLARGGAERQLIFMIQAARALNHEVRVLCLTRGEDYESQIEALGIEIEWIGQSANRLIRVLKIVDNLRKNPADIIQSSHFYTNIYAGIAGKILQIQSIGAIRSNFLTEVSAHGFLGKWQIRLPNFLIANSDSAIKCAVEFGIQPEEIEFVRNAVEIPQVSEKNAGNESALTMLFAGSLTAHKRPEHFINLAGILMTQFPFSPLRFLIAGDGFLRQKLEQMTRETHIADSVRFLGICKDMTETYRQSDVLISTSAYEGTPNVILEAMAHGLPVIAPKVGGIPEILNETRGFLVEPNDVKSFVAPAVKLLRNRSLRRKLGESGLDYVRKNHSLESLTEHLNRIYESIIYKNCEFYKTQNLTKSS